MKERKKRNVVLQTVNPRSNKKISGETLQKGIDMIEKDFIN